MIQVAFLWRSLSKGLRRTPGWWSSSNWTSGPVGGSWNSRRRNPDVIMFSSRTLCCYHDHWLDTKSQFCLIRGRFTAGLWLLWLFQGIICILFSDLGGSDLSCWTQHVWILSLNVHRRGSSAVPLLPSVTQRDTKSLSSQVFSNIRSQPDPTHSTRSWAFPPWFCCGSSALQVMDWQHCCFTGPWFKSWLGLYTLGFINQG